jgi:hypothetical protein
MQKKQKKAILQKYLGFTPALFDLRKKAILNDKINIEQWRINMNFLICKHGTIHSCEKSALEYWAETTGIADNDKSKFEGYLQEHVTPVLLNISDAYLDLPRILCRGQDRNWFFAGYPDVFEYFYCPPNLFAEDSETEKGRVEAHVNAVKADRQKMEVYLAEGKGSQTMYLVRMKTFYKNELRKGFLLYR